MSPSPIIRRTALALLSLGAIALAPASRASDIRSGAPPAWYAINPGVTPMRMMHMMDKEKSGAISRDEFVKFHEELFDEIDANHDGKISVEEWMGRSASVAKGASSQK